MNSNNRLAKLNKLNIVVLLLAILLTFIVFELVYMPHDYDNLGGKHIWVSGSTIKFVNMWLEEGATNLHFTNYELFPSIEYATLEDRMPYVSYPTGVTFMVWSAAKICGLTRIDVSFLKHYQMILYGIECGLMAMLIYSIVSKVTNWKEIRYGGIAKLIIAYLISVFWMTLPVNNWFMTNIFWTDIAVLLWVIALLLLESISDEEFIDAKWKKAIFVAKGFVIFAGILTEYFFYIVVFMLFVINLFRLAIDNQKYGKLKRMISSSCQYVIPVLLGLMVYLWQLSYTQNWWEKLLETFLHRTGVEDNEASLMNLVENLGQAIVCGSKKRAILFGVGLGIIVVSTVVIVIKNRIVKNAIASKEAITLFTMITAPILQLLIFSNHSAIHQYAMVKVGLVLVGLFICLAYISIHIVNEYVRYGCALFTTVLILVAMGYPGQPRNYYFEKNKQYNYDISRVIYNETDYSDVCVSYTYAIDFEPPMDICVSEKCVHIIKDSSDVQSIKAGLSDEARVIMIIDKNNVGSNNMGLVEDKSEYIIDQEAKCMREGIILYEDDKCALVDLKDIF